MPTPSCCFCLTPMVQAGEPVVKILHEAEAWFQGWQCSRCRCRLWRRIAVEGAAPGSNGEVNHPLPAQ